MKHSTLRKLKINPILLLTAFFFIGYCQTVYSQYWNQLLKVTAADRENKITSGRSYYDLFGISSAIYGSYAVVGAQNEDEDDNGKNWLENAGAVYLFKFVNNSWVKVKKLTPSDRSAYDNFGIFVTLNNDYIVIKSARGAVYIFKKDEGGSDNWGQIKKIQPSQDYGYNGSVSIDGDYIAVGAPFDNYDISGNNYLYTSGAVYLFKKDQGGAENWGQFKKITSPNRNANDQFGNSVGMSDGSLIVGAPFDDYDDSQNYFSYNAGAAYFFSKDEGGSDQWGAVRKVVSSQRAYQGSFGYSVGINGERAVVGAQGEDFNYSDQVADYVGGAYIFKKNEGGINNWGRIKRLAAPSPNNYDRFGESVAINGDQVIVGAAQYNLGKGSAFVFRENQSGNSNWGITKMLAANVPQYGDNFGICVSIDGDNTIVGASYEDEDDNDGNTMENAGSAFIFNKNLNGVENWGLQKKLTASTGTKGYALFGNVLAISGKYAIVGAHGDDLDEQGTNLISAAGSAYILYNDAGTWKQIKKICAPVRGHTYRFGESVAIQGDYAIVGAMYTQTDALETNPVYNAGAAYIFKKDQGGPNNWGLVKKITAGSRSSDDLFGASVGISGAYAVVGALHDGDDANEQNPMTQTGSVYIFKKDEGGENNWGQLKKVTASTRFSPSGFGNSVYMAGDLLIVGAPYELLTPTGGIYQDERGAAYVFDRNFGGSDNWGQAHKLTPTIRNANSHFGISVAITSGYAVVGADGERLDASESNYTFSAGAAYVFKKDASGTGWTQARKISASFRSENDSFGKSVAIEGDYVLIGSIRSASMFKKTQGGNDNWGYYQSLSRTFTVNGDYYGVSVGMAGKYALVGSNYQSNDSYERNVIPAMGATYIFYNPESALPVTLTSFEAKRNELEVILSWKTAAEVNSNYFEVQRSSNGVRWDILGERIPASGNAFSYSYADRNPFSGENLYRLKMVDKDGTFAYSRMVSLLFDGEEDLVLYPNPVSEKLYLQHSRDASELKSVEIFNDLGQSVMRTHKIISSTISVNSLKPGVYLIRIEKTNGEVKRQKISIQR